MDNNLKKDIINCLRQFRTEQKTKGMMFQHSVDNINALINRVNKIKYQGHNIFNGRDGNGYQPIPSNETLIQPKAD